MTTRDEPTHYELLGVPEDASTDEIKKAYRKLSRATHPDVNPAAGKLFTLVNRAHDILSDPSKRAEYDRQLKNPTDSYSHPAPEEQAPPEHAEPAWGDEAAWDATSGDEEVPAFVVDEASDAREEQARIEREEERGRQSAREHLNQQRREEELKASRKKAWEVVVIAIVVVAGLALELHGLRPVLAYVTVGCFVIGCALLAVWAMDNEVNMKARVPRYASFLLAFAVVPSLFVITSIEKADWSIMWVCLLAILVGYVLPLWIARVTRNHLRLLRAES